MNAPLILSVASPPPVCALDFKQLHAMLHNGKQSKSPSIPPHGSVDSTASLWFLPRTLKSFATFPPTLFWCLLTAKLESLEESYEQHQQYIMTAYGQVVAVGSTSRTDIASNAAVFVTLEDLMSRINQLHECIVLSMSGLSLLLRTVDLYYGSSFRPSSSSSSSSFPIHIHDLYLTQLQETYRFPSLCKLHMDISHLHQQTTHAQSIIGNIYHHIKVILHNRSSRNVSGTPPPSSSPFSLPLHAMQVDRPVLPPGVGSISASSVHSQTHAPTPGVESGSAASPFASSDSSASSLRDRGCACSSSCSCTCSSADRCLQACSNTKQAHVYAQNSIAASPPAMSTTTATTTTSSASATNNGTTADLLSMSPQSPYPSSFAPTSTPSSTSSYPTDTLSPSTFLSIGMLRICSAFCPPICSCEQETCQCHYATMAPEEHKETDRLTQVPADHDTLDDDYNQTEKHQEPQHRQPSNDNVSHAASSRSNSVDAAAEVLVNGLSQQSSAVNSTVNELPLRSAALASVGAPSVKSTFTSISRPSALATDSHPIERQLQTQVQQAETKANEASSTMLRAGSSTSPGATDVTLNASHTTSSRFDLQVVDILSHEPATQARLVTCHQCKSSRAESQVVGCTNQADVFKKCMLKYCFSCLLKHYRVALRDVDKTKFVCFRCLGRCTCALCRRARTSRGGWSGSLGIALASTSLASTHTAHHSSHPHSHSHPMHYFPQHKHSVEQSRALQTTWTTNQTLPPSTSFPASVTRSSASISSIFSGTGSCHYCKVKKLLFRLATCGKGDTQRHVANSAEMGIESSTYNITSTGTVNILKRKVCHKHFCDTCLFKHFAVTLQQIHQQQLVSNSWLCPACEGSCRCPACSRKKSKPTSSGTLPTSTFHNFDQQQPISDLNIMSSQS